MARAAKAHVGEMTTLASGRKEPTIRKRARRDSDTPYLEPDTGQSAVASRARSRREKKRVQHNETQEMEETIPPKFRRFSDSTFSSGPLTPPQYAQAFPPHIVSPESSTDSVESGVQTSVPQNGKTRGQKRTAGVRGGNKRKGKAESSELDLDAALKASLPDPIAEWTRAFSLQARHEEAARLIRDYLVQDATFAFLDDQLRTASAFSLALLLMQWHPGPVKFTRRTGISFADVDWSRRMLLAYEPLFRSLLINAGLLSE